ncbi:hypothetical protein [Geobacillus subterraneus]|nr:hypothetical protein [Geobacillus subterraneus]
MKRLYVVEKTIKTPDGERLQIIEVFESKPKDFSYIVFVEK